MWRKNNLLKKQCDVRLEGDDVLVKTYSIADVKYEGKIEEEKENIEDRNFVKESELNGDSPQFAFISEKDQEKTEKQEESKVIEETTEKQFKKNKKFKRHFKKNAKR